MTQEMSQTMTQKDSSESTVEEDRFSTKAWPTEVRVKKAEKLLIIAFDDGKRFELPAEYLRVESPSAEVQGHSPSQKKTVPGRRHVGIMDVEQVGNYAIRLSFDDLHDTGIYTWQYLYDLGLNYDAKWANYLSDLAAQGLSRDP